MLAPVARWFDDNLPPEWRDLFCDPEAARFNIGLGLRWSAALAELFFTAFFVNYATDLKIGRLTPQKVDPKNYRSRKTVDVLAIMTGVSKQGDPGDFLDAFESHNPHYQALKKMLSLYRAMEDGLLIPVERAGKPVSRTKSQSSAKSCSVSPGKPTMKVVRRVTLGTVAQIRWSSLS